MKVKSAKHAALAGLIASLITACSLFITFRIASEYTSINTIGCWALVQSVFILSRLPDMGLGINFVRMTAVKLKQNPNFDMLPATLAGFAVSTLPVALVGVITIPITIWILSVSAGVIDAPMTPIFSFCMSSLIYSIANAASTIFLSIVEGSGAVSLRQMITAASNIVLGLSIYPLVRRYGADGLGYAYIAYSISQLIFSILAANRRSVIRRCDLSSVIDELKALWRENLTTSAMALTRVTFEPWTKLLVGHTSGLIATAYVDLAFRISTQIRTSVQAAMQPLMFIGSRRDHQASQDLHLRFERAASIAVDLNIIFIALQVVFSPIILDLALHKRAISFSAFVTILAICNGINSIGVIGYYFAASGGQVGSLLRIHIRMMVINLCLGALLAYFIGPTGAIIGYGAAFATGGVELFWIYYRSNPGIMRHLISLSARSIAVLLIPIFWWIGISLLHWDGMRALYVQAAIFGAAIGVIAASTFRKVFIVRSS